MIKTIAVYNLSGAHKKAIDPERRGKTLSPKASGHRLTVKLFRLALVSLRIPKEAKLEWLTMIAV
jgi:hypothetical protein